MVAMPGADLAGWKRREDWQPLKYGNAARRDSLPRKRQMLAQMNENRAVTILTSSAGTDGRGDLLYFCRAVPMLRALSGDARLTLKVEEQFHRLFAANFPGVVIVPSDTDEPFLTLENPPHYDRGIPLADLLSIVRSAGVADPIPWLHADPGLVARYGSRMPDDAVGVCWARSGGRQHDHFRSIPLAHLAPLWSRPCVSLQVGGARHQIEGTPVIDVLPPDPDWADIAAVAACCGAVVSVDTGVAHLASALGCELYLIGFHDFAIHPRATEWVHTLYDLRRPDVAALLAGQIAGGLVHRPLSTIFRRDPFDFHEDPPGTYGF